MNVIETKLNGLLILEPTVYEDERGSFFESWNVQRYAGLGVEGPFVQDNVSFSRRGVLRGLHFQNPNPQGKLVSVLHGAAWDVAVDLRTDSRTFGQWVGEELSAENRRQIWVPPGFAHGFQALCDGTVFSYKCTGLYEPGSERSVRWDDPDLGIDWPLRDPSISDKDRVALFLQEVPTEGFFHAISGAVTSRA